MPTSKSLPATISSSQPRLTFKNFCATVERFHFKYNTLPTRGQFNQEFGTNVSQEKWEAYTEHENFAKYLLERNLLNTKYATPEMVRIADALLDVNLPSMAIKLKAAGCTMKEYNAVKNNLIFLEVLRERTARLPERERASVLTSLAKRATDGNVGAARLWLELTGEYSPRSTQSVEIHTTSQKEIVTKLIEAVQRHVSPEVMIAIANDFEAILNQKDSGPVKAIASIVPAIVEPEFILE